jgi:hypothetical protein
MGARLRGPKAYARRAPVREPYDRVLIVCEGEKTEPSYFGGLRQTERLSSANIKITPADGSDPLSIVQFAERFLDEYDRVYCVFDRDGHANYNDALRRVSQSPAGRAGKLTPITSWPCFEFWLLLHFRYSSAAIVPAGKRSSGTVAFDTLRQHLPTYEKGHASIYAELLTLRDAAMKNAARLQRENRKTGSTNPSTCVHDLVDYLLKLKDSV